MNLARTALRRENSGGYTIAKKISPNKRIMLMGNAVVVDLLEDIFIELAKRPLPPF